MRNFAAIKAKARRDIHDAMSVAAEHVSASSNTRTPLSVRWHNKLVLLGDSQDSGYSNVIEGIERIIFLRSELSGAGVNLQQGDAVVITAEGFENAELILTVKEPVVGPTEEAWQVVRR